MEIVGQQGCDQRVWLRSAGDLSARPNWSGRSWRICVAVLLEIVDEVIVSLVAGRA